MWRGLLAFWQTASYTANADYLYCSFVAAQVLYNFALGAFCLNARRWDAARYASECVLFLLLWVVSFGLLALRMTDTLQQATLTTCDWLLYVYSVWLTVSFFSAHTLRQVDASDTVDYVVRRYGYDRAALTRGMQQYRLRHFPVDQLEQFIAAERACETSERALCEHYVQTLWARLYALQQHEATFALAQELRWETHRSTPLMDFRHAQWLDAHPVTAEV